LRLAIPTMRSSRVASGGTGTAAVKAHSALFAEGVDRGGLLSP
jgi:hypothetical protein